MNTEQPFDNSTAKILVVDDTIDSLRLLANMLTEQGYNVRKVLNGQMALTAAQAAPPDLILLDINMPQINGYEVCQQLKANEDTVNIPVIFISALDEVLDKVKAFAVGGIDYITKPYQFEEVIARVETQLALRFLKQQLAEQITKATEVESQYSRLFTNANVGVFQISPNGYYLSINPALAQMYGYESSDFMRADLLNGTPYIDNDRWQELTTLLVEQEKLLNIKSQVIDVNQKTFSISENIWVVKDKQGKILHYEGTVQRLETELTQ